MSHINHRDLLIVDVESTCWEGAAPGFEESEIIEVGWTILPASPEPDGEYSGNLLIKPERSQVSAFCTALTGHTTEGLKDGLSFERACMKMRSELHFPKFLWASWGDYDLNMFRRQCNERSAAYPFGPRHLNLKVMFSWLYGLGDGLSVGDALGFLGLEFEGRQHSGADDARNIARIAARMKKDHGSISA